MTRRERQRFVKEAQALLLSLGAVQQGDDFILQTKAGRLTLHPAEDRLDGLGTVFTRFDDPQAARKLVDCNRFSGKWNQNYFHDWTTETAIYDLGYQLSKVLIPADANVGAKDEGGGTVTQRI
jgi:hypothetical protein